MTKLTLQPPKATGNSTVTSRSLKVRWVPVRELKPYPANARRHSDKQIRQIASSIERFGWTNAILVDGEGSIIAGHGRVEAAKLLGLIEVPTIGISDPTETEKRAYIIADNRLAGFVRVNRLESMGWVS